MEIGKSSDASETEFRGQTPNTKRDTQKEMSAQNRKEMPKKELRWSESKTASTWSSERKRIAAERAKIVAVKYAKFKCEMCDYAGYTAALLETHWRLKGHWPLRPTQQQPPSLFAPQVPIGVGQPGHRQSSTGYGPPASSSRLSFSNQSVPNSTDQRLSLPPRHGSVVNQLLDQGTFENGGNQLISDTDRTFVAQMLAAMGLDMPIPAGTTNVQMLTQLENMLLVQREKDTVQKEKGLGSLPMSIQWQSSGARFNPPRIAPRQLRNGVVQFPDWKVDATSSQRLPFASPQAVMPSASSTPYGFQYRQQQQSSLYYMNRRY